MGGVGILFISLCLFHFLFLQFGLFGQKKKAVRFYNHCSWHYNDFASDHSFSLIGYFSISLTVFLLLPLDGFEDGRRGSWAKSYGRPFEKLEGGKKQPR